MTVLPIADWCPNPAIHATVAVRRFAAHVIDQNSREWIDLLSGFGSNLLGYDHPAVLDAVCAQLERGIGTGIRTGDAAVVERLLQDTIPCAEGVAFGKNGSDATAAAVRLARAVTGRDLVLVRGYHGFHDWFLASDPQCAGIPRALRATVEMLPPNDLVAFEDLISASSDSVAAVIIDPAAHPAPDSDYLRKLVELCRENGIVAIFDEVVTGFRLAPGGAQEYHGVTPDLACVSKAMANGFPISALVGNGEMMSALPATRFGMTFGSEAVSMAAARATINVVRSDDVCSTIRRTGEMLREGVATAAVAHGIDVELRGAAPQCTQILFAPQNGLSERELRWLFLQELARRDVLSVGMLMVSAAHTTLDVEQVVDAAVHAFGVLKQAKIKGSVEGLLRPDVLGPVRAADTAGMTPAEDEASPKVVVPESGTGPGLPRWRRAARRVVPFSLRERIRQAVTMGPPSKRPVAGQSVSDLLQHVPADFDWRAYLERYCDLRASDISTEIEAMHHYVHYGAAEGRWASRTTTTPKTAMSCPAMHSMFLRAWGGLSCWDDAGAASNLQPFDEKKHYGEDVFLGPVLGAIRDALHENRMPFPDMCSRCICLESEVEMQASVRDRPIMETLHVEPSYLCGLSCPGCIPRDIRRHAPQPLTLDAAIFEKILRDLAGSGIEVNRVCYQGHGEPLTHPDLPALVRLARSTYPDAYQTINTNANRKFDPALVECGINEFVFSIDGINQESYEPYRIGGRFDLAYDFMRQVARANQYNGSHVKTVWRYILFEHNSEPRQLIEAQEMARDIGVDEVLFVFTRLGPRSTTVVRASQVPILESGVTVRFQSNEPDVADLERRLRRAQKLLESGITEAVVPILGSVGRTLHRYFATAKDVGPSFRSTFDSLTELVERLPENERRDIRENMPLQPELSDSAG